MIIKILLMAMNQNNIAAPAAFMVNFNKLNEQDLN